MAIAETPRPTDAVIERFMEHVERIPAEIHSDVENLFAAQRDKYALARLYYSPRGAHEGFAIQRGAFYHLGEQLPYLTILRLSAGQHLELSRQGNDWASLKAVNADEEVQSWYLQNSRLKMLEGLTFTKGRKGNEGYVEKRVPRIYDILQLENPIERFNYFGVAYDEGERNIELVVPNGTVTASIDLNVDSVLERYFPHQLREGPFEAGVEHDVWASADWLADFGVDWQKVNIVKTPVFAPTVTPQNTNF